MISVISKEKKKSYLLFDKYDPVLLTTQYPEYYEKLIEFALNRQITLCCRADIISANGISISEDFPLSPAQIIEILQEKFNVVTIKIILPEHLAKSNNKKLLTVKVGVNGLFVNKTEIDNILNNINQPTCKNQTQSNQLQIKLKNDDNRPSESSRDKSQRITQEFEDIIINGILDLDSINLDTIWKTAIKQAEEGKSSRFISNNQKLIDKQTSKVWTSELAYKHKKKVISWINKFKNDP
jgi:hypothetical protein